MHTGIFSVIAALFIFSLTSCDSFFEPIDEFFDNHTDCVVGYSINVPTARDSVGRLCVPSSAVSVTFYISNEHSYPLSSRVTVPDASWAASPYNSTFDSSYISYESTTRGTTITISYPYMVLTPLEPSSTDLTHGAAITPTLILTRSDTGEAFDVYTTPALYVNSPPLPPTNVTAVNYDVGYSTELSSWVLCITMPAYSNLHKDISVLCINGTDYPITISSGTYVVSSPLTTTYGSNYLQNIVTGRTYTDTINCIFLPTNDTAQNYFEYEVTIKDAAGLTSSVVTASTAF